MGGEEGTVEFLSLRNSLVMFVIQSLVTVVLKGNNRSLLLMKYLKSLATFFEAFLS